MIDDIESKFACDDCGTEFTIPPQNPSRLSLHERIIIAARRLGADVGHGAMIAEMEWGYWVGGGACYVSKTDVEKC